jgi:hypothetical protein
MRVKCAAYPILFDLTALTVFDEDPYYAIA